jgi:hypothetical protein
VLQLGDLIELSGIFEVFDVEPLEGEIVGIDGYFLIDLIMKLAGGEIGGDVVEHSSLLAGDARVLSFGGCWRF